MPVYQIKLAIEKMQTELSLKSAAYKDKCGSLGKLCRQSIV
jgi:hypothetical protein